MMRRLRLRKRPCWIGGLGSEEVGGWGILYLTNGLALLCSVWNMRCTGSRDIHV